MKRCLTLMVLLSALLRGDIQYSTQNATTLAGHPISDFILNGVDPLSIPKVSQIYLRSAAGGSVNVYAPTASTDTARGVALLAAVTASAVNDTIEVGPGDYLVSSFTLKEGQTLLLNGGRIYKNNHVGDMITTVGKHTIIRGSGILEGDSTTGAYTESSGIYVSTLGDGVKISGVTIKNFRGCGIRISAYSTSGVENQGTITDVRITGCSWGLYFTSSSEYWSCRGLTLNSNITGVYIGAGNVLISDSNITWNTSTGIYLNEEAGNSGHGIISNCQINHNTTYSLYVNGITIGETLMGNNFFGGDIYLNACKGINIIGGLMGSPTTLTLNGTFTGYNYIKDVWFYDRVLPISGTSAQLSYLILRNNQKKEYSANEYPPIANADDEEMDRNTFFRVSSTGVGTLNTWTDGTRAWTTNQWVDYYLWDGATPKNTWLISANDATTLTISGTPITGTYYISRFGFHSGVSASTATLDTLPGYLSLANGAVTKADYLKQKVYYSGDFTISSYVSQNQTGFSGIFAVDTAGTGYSCVMYSQIAGIATSGYAASGVLVAWASSLANTVSTYGWRPNGYVQLKRVGTAVLCSWSVDGLAWQPVYQYAGSADPIVYDGIRVELYDSSFTLAPATAVIQFLRTTIP